MTVENDFRSVGFTQFRRWSWAALVLAGLAAWGVLVTAQGVSGENEGSEQELETFVPTEEVAADQAVAFPVDI